MLSLYNPLHCFHHGGKKISDMLMNNSLFQHLCLMLADNHCTAKNKLDIPQILPSLL